jgi:hypothetical protein
LRDEFAIADGGIAAELAGELNRATGEFPEQGNFARNADPLAPTHPTSAKVFISKANKITNYIFMLFIQHAPPLRTGRAGCDANVGLKHLFRAVALGGAQ